ncbi:SHOCT domain-containing protein [Thiolapillus sp.]|uniref:SHOCT domain-containing protein n=3 Tax=Thiolapillus sp. TaxID=2017437 RepID=UPI003AF8E4F0
MWFFWILLIVIVLWGVKAATGQDNRGKSNPKSALDILKERYARGEIDQEEQACLRPRDRFWDIPVPKIDSAFDNLFVPQPSWSPSTTQQLRKLVAAPYLSPNDWTPRSEAYFVFPLAQGTPGKQCGLAATGDYQPSLRSPWLAADVIGFIQVVTRQGAA